MPRWLLPLPAMALVAGCILLPLLLLVRVSLYEPATGRGFYTPSTWTGDNFASLFDTHGLGLLGFTLGFAGLVAVATLVLGYPLALFVRSLPGRQKTIALAFILLPKTAGLLAMLFGLQRLLPRGFLAAWLAEVYLILPYAVLVLVLQLQAIPAELTAAARGLGANRWQAFHRVTWPLSLPGLILAGELGLLWGLAAFLGPLFLGGPDEMTLAVDVHRQAFEYGRWPRAAAEAVILLGLTVVVLARPVRGGSRP